MPIYEAECLDCGRQHDYVRPVAHYLDVPVCPCCGGESRRVILTAPTSFVKGKFEQFRSTIDGTLIRTEKDLREHNRRNGVVNLNEGYTDEELKNYTPPPPVTPKKEEVVADIVEAIEEVKHGYKPEKIQTDLAPVEGWSTTEVPNE